MPIPIAASPDSQNRYRIEMGRPNEQQIPFRCRQQSGQFALHGELLAGFTGEDVDFAFGPCGADYEVTVGFKVSAYPSFECCAALVVVWPAGGSSFPEATTRRGLWVGHPTDL